MSTSATGCGHELGERGSWGRVAVITGAASGINRATAMLLASEGYSVAAVDLNGEGLQATVGAIRDRGGSAHGHRIDVSDRDAVRSAVAEVVGKWGRVDVLVSGAGYLDKVPFLDLREDAWDRMLAVHLKAAYIASQAVLPHMREAGYGRIVCISSTAAIVGTHNHSHYAAAKAGLLGFVRALAMDVGPWGVTVNAVVPGAVDTPLVPGVGQERFAEIGSIPVGRVGQPQDIAAAIRFLVGEDSGYVSGTHLIVNGGL